MEEDIDGGIQVDGEDTLQLRGIACDEGRAIAPLLLTLISVKINSIFTRIALMYGTNKSCKSAQSNIFLYICLTLCNKQVLLVHSTILNVIL